MPPQPMLNRPAALGLIQSSRDTHDALQVCKPKLEKPVDALNFETFGNEHTIYQFPGPFYQNQMKSNLQISFKVLSQPALEKKFVSLLSKIINQASQDKTLDANKFCGRIIKISSTIWNTKYY